MLSFASVGCCPTALSQQNLRDIPVSHFQFDGDALSAILSLGEKARVSLGIICSSSGSLNSRVLVNVENSTFGATMDKVLRTLPEYHLSVDQKIAHVLPVEMAEAQNKLLGLQISRFYSPSSAPEAVNMYLQVACERSIGIKRTDSKQGGVVDLLTTSIDHDTPLAMERATMSAGVGRRTAEK